jgi:hypothetical protein
MLKVIIVPNRLIRASLENSLPGAVDSKNRV